MQERAEQRPVDRRLRKKRAVKVRAINLWENSWPVARAADAIQALSFRVGLACKATQAPQAPAEVMEGNADASRAWVSALVHQCGLRGDSKQASYSAMPQLLGAGPSLLQVNFEKGARLIALNGLEAALGGGIGEGEQTGWGYGKIEIISPGGGVIRTTVANLRTALANELERKISEDVAPLFGELSIENNCRQEILQQVYEKRLGEERIAEVWKLDVPISAGIMEHARRAGAWRHLAAFLTTYGIEYGLWIVSWVLVGRWALEGRLDTGWLVAWALLLLTVIPIHMMSRWEQTKFAVSGAAVVMRQLLEGTFKLLPEEVRYGGVGQMIAQVLDSQALQSLALSGAITGLVAIFEITASGVLLATVEKAGMIALLLAIWAGLSFALAFAFHRRRHEWTDARLDMTGDLVERMVGHRTRVVQQERQFWHDGEDAALCSYVEKSKRMDRLGIIFIAVVPRGWLLVGIAAIAPGFIQAAQSTGILAAQLGAVLLAFGALQKLSLALADICGAEIAWEHSRDLLVAADRTEAAGDPAIAVAANAAPSGRLLEMRNVMYRYPRRNADAIQRAFVEIEPGDRILLHGRSGSGKSTFAGLASGVRVPDSGLLFLRGIDRKTLGERQWRRLVASSPQFHENHIFAGTLAFNLLMGRRWPPAPEDLVEAESVCRELGLGALLDAMPGGLMQIVGETGWQLSNGEKSRVFLARTLLQRADMVILDETFAALDPETSRETMNCVLRRAPAGLCVAHL